MNFFCLKMANVTTLINQLLIVDVGETSGPNPIITHNGAEVLEHLCGDNIWRIECYPPKLNSRCSTLQKDIKHYYKAIIIHKQTNCGILDLCYVGYCSTTQGLSMELHNFWFCHDDLMHCVGRTRKKYVLDRLALLSLWHVQARINLTQIKVVALEEDGFLFSEKPRCSLINQVGDDISTLVNHPSECAPQNLFGNGIFTHIYKQ